MAIKSIVIILPEAFNMYKVSCLVMLRKHSYAFLDDVELKITISDCLRLLAAVARACWEAPMDTELWDVTAVQVTDGEKMKGKRERSVTWKMGQLSVAMAGEEDRMS